MPARRAVPPSPLPTSGLRKLLFYKINHPTSRLESTLLQVFILGSLKPIGLNTYEKQGEGCHLRLTKYYKKVPLVAGYLLAARLPARQSSLSVLVPHFPFSRFQFPFSPSALRLRASARQTVFHSIHASRPSRDEKPVTATPLDSALTNRDARNPFRIRSYETWGVSLAPSSLFSLFAPRLFHNSFAIKRFRTLSKNSRGVGVTSLQAKSFFLSCGFRDVPTFRPADVSTCFRSFPESDPQCRPSFPRAGSASGRAPEFPPRSDD
jgi:hypothetical protein